MSRGFGEYLIKAALLLKSGAEGLINVDLKSHYYNLLNAMSNFTQYIE
jgi:hypothetical protein